MKPVMIISTYPDRRSVKRIARELVTEGTAACVNISRISSIYSWEGKVNDSSEYLAIFKTTAKKGRLLKKRIQESHPYDVPEIAQIDVTSINRPYFEWLAGSTG